MYEGSLEPICIRKCALELSTQHAVHHRLIFHSPSILLSHTQPDFLQPISILARFTGLYISYAMHPPYK